MIQTCVHICAHICVHAHGRTPTPAHKHIHIHTHIHTHTHKRSLTFSNSSFTSLLSTSFLLSSVCRKFFKLLLNQCMPSLEYTLKMTTRRKMATLATKILNYTCNTAYWICYTHTTALPAHWQNINLLNLLF